MLGSIKQLLSQWESESTTRFRESKCEAEILWPTLGSSNSPLTSCPLSTSMSFCSQDQGHRLALMDKIFNDMTKEGLKCVVKVKVAQLCPTVCNPGLYSPWNSPGQNTGVDNLSLCQGVLPIQRVNPGLLHCRQILYQLSHQGSPRILEWVAYPFSSGSSQRRNWTRISCIAGGFFTNWATREVS